MPDTTTLLALVTGHLLGDFVLQSDAMAERKAHRGRWQVVHATAVAGVTWLLLGTIAAAWAAAALFVLHLGIDLLKRRLSPRLRWFTLDQVLHGLSLVGLWLAIDAFAPSLPGRNVWTSLWASSYAAGLLLVAGFVVTVWLVGVVVKYQMADFAGRLPGELVEGLPRAGRAVGRLERTLVFLFVLIGQPEAVGFVVAAKSVFRIGDLTKRDQRNHAEYIMIGTLRSFAYALLLALATRWLFARIAP
ncbi:MAG: DUF3307 domain-containing protein [Candidatus Krumholzibacteria bacterium]|jgi:hypothetical protein|nr:DUF3307 domain-containing protein [Candidatus Krumholzibacteria bacterium]